MKDNKMIKYPLILGLIALVSGLLLALVYNITAPIIEDNTNKRENAAILEIFGEDAEIENISNKLNSEDNKKGLNNAYIVKSNNKSYYVYKITVKDGVGNDDSSAVVALDSGKIHTLKFITIGDDYAKTYDSKSYIDRIAGKDSLTDNDVVGDATYTGEYLIEAITAAIDHQGRVK